MKRQAILRSWPEMAVLPAKLTLWKWLTRAVREGQFLQKGYGTRKDPFEYSLPSMVEKWQANFLADFMRSLEPDGEGAAPLRCEN